MEAWWWRDDVDAAISVKRIKYKNYKTLKKTGPIYLVEEASELYNIAKRNAKHLVWLAKSDSAKRTFNGITANGNEIYRIAKQIQPGCCW